MRKGVVLFAHNTAGVDYYQMAVYAAKQVNKFLDLPVTVITDHLSVTDLAYQFDHVEFLKADSSNSRNNTVWNNKGRYQVYDLSPYDDTLIIDVDYVINSPQLLSAFDYTSDVVCHNVPKMLMQSELEPELLSANTIPTLWATVIRFTKSKRAQQVFDMIKMVQENYEHYSRLYKFNNKLYRNDYALTVALKTVNHHLENPLDYFNWKLLHVTDSVKVYRDSETAYTLYMDGKNGQRNQYIKIKDLDFHMLDKENFMELIV